MLGGNRIEMTYKDRDHWKNTSFENLKEQEQSAPSPKA